MSNQSSIARTMMMRDVAAARRAHNPDQLRRTGQWRPATPGTDVSYAGRVARSLSALPGSVSPYGSDRSFADVLAMVTGQPATGQERLSDPRLAANRPASTPTANRQANTPAVGRPAELAGTGQPPLRPAKSDQEAPPLGAIPYSDLITAAAKKYDVSPSLVAAVIKAESGFEPKAQSKAGAKGLMQLMDDTARRLGVTSSFDPTQNIEGGTKYLSSLLKKFNGNTTLALAAYNAGSGAVEKHGGIPPFKETRDYIANVLGYWRQYSESFRS